MMQSLEEAYRDIGWWKGPVPARELRQQSEKFWAERDADSIQWLLTRLRREHNVEVLEGAASLLASLGSRILPQLLDEIWLTPVGDNGYALFGALARLSSEQVSGQEERLQKILKSYLEHPLHELRQEAAYATACLPYQQAWAILEKARKVEENPRVQEVIEDVRKQLLLDHLIKEYAGLWQALVDS